jgi:hypothetical protein
MLRQTATHTSQLDVLSDASACTSTSCIRNLISNHHSFDAKHSDEINFNQSCEYVELREYGLRTYWPSDRACTASISFSLLSQGARLLEFSRTAAHSPREAGCWISQWIMRRRIAVWRWLFVVHWRYASTKPPYAISIRALEVPRRWIPIGASILVLLPPGGAIGLHCYMDIDRLARRRLWRKLRASAWCRHVVDWNRSIWNILNQE